MLCTQTRQELAIPRVTRAKATVWPEQPCEYLAPFSAPVPGGQRCVTGAQEDRHQACQRKGEFGVVSMFGAWIGKHGINPVQTQQWSLLDERVTTVAGQEGQGQRPCGSMQQRGVWGDLSPGFRFWYAGYAPSRRNASRPQLPMLILNAGKHRTGGSALVAASPEPLVAWSDRELERQCLSPACASMRAMREQPASFHSVPGSRACR